MEHPFFTTVAARAEAFRWLAIAEKLLSAHDLLGSKSFATRARESDPTLSQTDDILAVVDTLIAGERRIGSNQPDWYAVLRLTPQQGRDSQLIAEQHRRLVLLLNPQRNKFPFAEQAFRLIFDAWSVLSNPSRKSLYDKELAFYTQPPQPAPFNDPIPTLQQNFIFFGGGVGGAQPPVHGGGSSSSGLGASQYTQVHAAQPQVEPVAGGSTREPQNFMSFSPGYNFVFGSGSGSGSGSRSGYEPVNDQGQESYSAFAGNMASASVANQGQLNDLERQSQQNYSIVSDETIHNVAVSENVGEVIEDEEVGEGISVEEEEEEKRNVEVEEEKRNVEVERVDSPVLGDGSTFWTACPYCYYMYEYPGVYADCTLRCQNCKRAFQAVVISSPPPMVDGEEAYYCCWGFLPFGFSVEDWKKHNVATSAWTPFSPMVSCPQMGNNANEGVGGQRRSASRVYHDDNEVIVEISDSSDSDDDWQHDMNKKEKNKAKNVKGRKAIWTPGRGGKKVRTDKGKNANVQDAFVSQQGVELPNKATSEPSKMGAADDVGNQPGRVTKNFGKLDLNVELSNETGEPAMRTNQGNGSGRGEDDNIEGNGFFEGLDEFLSSLPILNVVGDDKVVKAA